MQPTVIVISLAVTLVAVALFARAAARIVAVVRLGKPDPTRSGDAGERLRTMLRETLGHTRMLQRTKVGIAHWFVFVGFGALFFTLVTAYGQLFSPSFAIPVLGHWVVYEWATEIIGWATLFGILALIVVRLANRPGRPTRPGRSSRFEGSTMWQGYYVEWTIVAIAACVLSLRGLEYALVGESGWSAHFPLTSWLGSAMSGVSSAGTDDAIVAVAGIKILVSMVWFIVLAANLTMGVAWHRFLAFPNIWFKRHANGRTSLGALQPIVVDGKPVDFENIEELDENAALGVGKIEDFTWKGLLDFSTCTECGRCQDQCPAWNTQKPLSPKLVILGLRDHAYAKAPYLLAAKAASNGASADGALASAAIGTLANPASCSPDAFSVPSAVLPPPASR